ncbi:MAG: flagellar M-ring protein FliF [Candidatus Midichloria sp.]|nr:flagellar M-ring protein FliF [Candidatus Midichloria sp.]
MKNLGTKKLMAFITAAIVLFISIIVFIFSISKPNLVPMYTSLTPEDTSAIVARLQSMSIPYSVESDSGQIKVPAEKVLALRMSLAQEGLPSSGQVAGYELFDKSDAFGTSQFVYNINMVRALEGELARTISSLSPIVSARVHLVLPKKELFSKNTSTPSASIVVKMKGAQQLSKAEIAAIAHIVATAVPDLKLGNITIVDDKGSPLKLSSENGDFMVGGIIDSATEYKINMETRLTKIIEDLVSKSVGFGKVKANVSADIDFDREVINYETYDPEGQVIRSQRTSSENDKDNEKMKDVSVANNIPNGNQQAQFFGKEKVRSDNITNYEISKKVGNKISEQGRIKSLSIAVLVDGVYIKDDKGQLVYSERPEEEMTKLKALVTSAVGLDLDRGDKLELINLRFINEIEDTGADEGFMAWIKGDAQGLIQTLIIGIVLIIIVIMISRIVMAKLASRDRDEEMITSLEGAMVVGAENMGTEANRDNAQEGEESTEPKPFEVVSADGVKYASVAKYLNDTVENHLDEAVGVIKNWLYK